MGKFLVMLAGAREEILARCPTERIKFQSLGWAILITSGIATISMWFALTSAMGINPVLAFPIAIAWGLAIMGIDRWLVTSIPSAGPRRWTIALPRLVLAILLGSLISTPIVLRVFQSEINAQLPIIRQDRLSAFNEQQQHSAAGRQVTSWTSQVNSLNNLISAGGNQNPATDPEIKTLTSELNTALAQRQKYYQQYQCQLYGGSNCPAGNGPLAKTSKQEYDQAQQQVTTLQTEITDRKHAIATDNTKAVQTAKAQLPGAQQQLDAAKTRENTILQNFTATNNADNGLLIRLQALNQLSGSNFTLNFVRFLIFIFFLVIECLPVTVKLVQRPGNYEKILATTADSELKAARRAIRLTPIPAGTSPAGSGRADYGTGDIDAADFRTAEPDSGPDEFGYVNFEQSWSAPAPADATASDRAPASQVSWGSRQPHNRVWDVWTKMRPQPSWRSTAVTEPLVNRADESEAASRLDTALREMPGLRMSAPEDPDGTELCYDDDDL